MKRFILPCILFGAFLLRFISLTSYPVGFNADEASFGYDAYSILQTGRDQWGHFLPIVLKSFGDYKSPIYTYLDIPFVKVLGLTVFAVRLPNVIIGTLAVFAVYLLSNQLFKKKFGIWNLEFGILPAILLAVNPWSVMMSRGGFEGNLITFFAPMGVYLFLKKKYVFSSIILGLGLFTYHSAKIIIPVLFVTLLIIYRREIKKLLPAIITFGVFLSVLIYSFAIGGGSRAAERSIFQGAQLQGAEERIKIINQGGNPIITKIFHNKYQVTFQRFINNYLEYLSPKFLFTGGAGEGSYGMIPGIGVLNIVEGIFLIGLIPFLILEKRSRYSVMFLFLWVLVAILPAALATGVGYSGNRAEGMLPALQILGALGFLGWWIWLKRFDVYKVDKKIVPVAMVLVCLVMAIQAYGFAKRYFRYPGDLIAGSMLYGNLETAKWLKENAGEKKVIVSRDLSEFQIFVAFVSRWNPTDYQKATKDWDVITWVDQIPEYSLGNYTFTSIDTKNIPKDELIIDKPIYGQKKP